MKNAVLIALGLAVGTVAALAQTGNGGPNGSHYNLNIIGKEQCPTDPQTNGNGHVIFVLLNGGDVATNLNGKMASNISKVNKIYLQQSGQQNLRRAGWQCLRRKRRPVRAADSYQQRLYHLGAGPGHAWWKRHYDYLR